MKKKILITSILSLVMCLSLAFGATFALFTSESTVNVAVTSGKVKVVAQVQDTAKKTLYETEWTAFDGTAQLNTAGGTVAVTEDGNVTLTKMLPGDAVKFNIKVFNKSNVTVKYRTSLTITQDSPLLDSLDITVDGEAVQDNASKWVVLSPVSNPEEAIMVYPVEISLADTKTQIDDDGNDIGGETLAFSVKVEAIQGNATPADGEESDDLMIFELEDLVAFRDAVNAGDTFKGKTVKLMKDINLSSIDNWEPIGKKWEKDATDNIVFSGTFDGNGKIISNLKVDRGTENNAGFFGVYTDATVKNLTINNATVKGGTNVGAIVGNGYTGTISNCKVTGDVKIDGNYKVGGMIGGDYTKIIDCVVDANDGSYVKATYVKAQVEGDNVGGLVGFTAEKNSEDVITGSVNNIEVVGTRKVGGAIGYLHENRSANVTVTNVIVSSNASEEYRAANVGKIIVGGIVGEVNAEALNINGSIKDSVVSGYETNLTKATVGGARNTTTAVDNATATNVTVKIAIADGVALVDGAYEISNANGMKWFADQVNGVGGVSNSFSEKTVKLVADIDLNNEEWTPIGQTVQGGRFAGTFDGNNKTIYNLKVSVLDSREYYSAGLFGFTDLTVVIKNLTIEGASVAGRHYTGAIIGFLTGTVENCQVKNAAITTTHLSDEACGDKAGALVGQVNTGIIKNSTAIDSTVGAGRDAGQIVGAALETEVSGCTATNVIVSAIDGCTGANIRNEIIGRIV